MQRVGVYTLDIQFRGADSKKRRIDPARKEEKKVLLSLSTFIIGMMCSVVGFFFRDAIIERRWIRFDDDDDSGIGIDIKTVWYFDPVNTFTYLS